MRIHCYGQTYEVPAAIAPEPALCQRFSDAIHGQLEALADAERIPKATVTLNCFRPDGEYDRDDTGAIKTRQVMAWLVLPDELHADVVVPTAEDITAAAAAPTPAAPAAPVTSEE